jgi:hypothetical protein
MRRLLKCAAVAAAAVAPVFGSQVPARADAISDNLNVIRMSPPLAYYTPGTIARGYLDKRTFQRTGERLLKVNVVRCRAKFDEDGFEQNLDGASFATQSDTSFGLSAGWASLLNASFKGSFVDSVSLSFTGTIYEYDEAKLNKLRKACLGSTNPKADQSQFQFQIVRLAVGKFEYKLNFKNEIGASLKANITQKFAGELGFNGSIDRGGMVTLPKGAMAFPLWREDW